MLIRKPESEGKTQFSILNSVHVDKRTVDATDVLNISPPLVKRGFRRGEELLPCVSEANPDFLAQQPGSKFHFQALP